MKIIKFIINILTFLLMSILCIIFMIFVPFEILIIGLFSLWDDNNYFLELDPLYYYIFEYWKENIYLK